MRDLTVCTDSLHVSEDKEECRGTKKTVESALGSGSVSTCADGCRKVTSFGQRLEILPRASFLPETQAVLSNGILMGGVFTMLYAVGMTVSADTSWLRLAVVTAALAITISVGYMKFTRGHKKDSLPVAASSDANVLAETVQDNNLDVRLTAVEAKLDALGDALRG